MKQKRKLRVLAVLSCFVLLVCTCFGRSFSANTVLAASTETIKIMPLGDSITNGDFWRTTLYNKLIENGYDVNFVGSNGDNEGHWGMRVCDLADSGDLAGWLDASNPDLVMMHFGTNDSFDDEKTTDKVLAAYTTLVEEMRANNPNMIIVVAKIIPVSSSYTVYNARIDAMNNSIDAWAAALTTTQSPITVVDQHTGFTDADLGDGVHPSSSGGLKMAEKWYEALSVILDGLQSGSESSVTSEPVVTSEAPITTEPVVTSETPVTTEPVVTSETPVTTEPVVTSETPVTTEPVVTSEIPVTTEPVVTSETPATTADVSDTENVLQLSTDVSSWSGGFTMTCNVKNTSAVQIDNWKLILSKADFTITNIWCAEMTETDDSYIITPMSWNQAISAGNTASFGFQGTGSVSDNFEYTLE